MRDRIGLAIVAAVVVGLTGWSAVGQQVGSSEGAGASSGSAGLITHVHEVEGEPITVIVVEPTSKVMAVYHVSRQSGEIKPKSIRSLKWDLQMQEFNSPELKPADIKKRLQLGN